MWLWWWWWLWWLWCVDGAITKTCLSMSTHACNEFKNRAGASAPAPSAGLTSRKKPYACSLRRQVPGVPSANLTQPQTQGEEKDCEAHPPHPPLLRRKQRSNLFHRLGVGCPGSGMNIEDAPGRVFLARFPKLLLQWRRLPEVTAPLLPTPLPNLGKTQGEICLVKIVVQ